MSQTTEILRTLRFLQLVRKHVEEDCTVKSLITLLGIAANPGIDQSSLGNKLDISRSTISKNIADLSTLKSNKKPGPGLVENRIDPMNLSIRMPTLTKKGEACVAKMFAEAFAR